jgi:hypothetical protein
MRPILPGLAVTYWSVFHRWVNNAKQRSPRQRTERISAFRARVPMSSSLTRRLLHRDMDAVTSAFVPGIGQHRRSLQERLQHAQDILPGRG